MTAGEGAEEAAPGAAVGPAAAAGRGRGEEGGAAAAAAHPGETLMIFDDDHEFGNRLRLVGIIFEFN